jgi:hypothetical protein
VGRDRRRGCLNAAAAPGLSRVLIAPVAKQVDGALYVSLKQNGGTILTKRHSTASYFADAYVRCFEVSERHGDEFNRSAILGARFRKDSWGFKDNP